MNVKPKITRATEKKKLTQNQLADMTGIPQASISRFDKNSQHLDLHLIKIAKALNVSLEELFEIEE
jgi:transcriptional regulator with XRE-family HTH domain